MAKKELHAPLFGPEQWVTMRETGEHVKVESWSTIADVYRVRSRKNGLQFASEAELMEVCAHPEVHLGKYWSRCRAPGCGAPLTPQLSLCPQCLAPTCSCGRCQCVPKATRTRTVRKKAASRTR